MAVDFYLSVFGSFPRWKCPEGHLLEGKQMVLLGVYMTQA
jgi:hypothetical protein